MTTTPSAVRILDWRELRKNSLLGFAKVELHQGWSSRMSQSSAVNVGRGHRHHPNQ
jgi:hypothetical protein